MDGLPALAGDGGSSRSDGAGARTPEHRTREGVLARFKERLGQRQVLLGVLHASGSSAVAEMIGYAGFDFAIVDMEHGGYGVERLEALVRAVEVGGAVALVRVLSNDPHLIMQAMDTGAQGVLVPHVRTAGECQAALAAMHFRPVGIRGKSGGSRASCWGLADGDRYEAWSNTEPVMVPIIEDREALDHLEEIVAVPGVEIVAVGPGDLSQSFGEPGKGLRAPRVMAALEQTVELCEPRGIAVMTIPMPGMTAELVAEVAEKGARVVWYGSDLSHLAKRLVTIAEDAQRAVGRSDVRRSWP